MTTPQPLTTFRVTYTDNTSYVTNAASGVSLAEFEAYITQAPHVYETPSGQEYVKVVWKVEKL